MLIVLVALSASCISAAWTYFLIGRRTRPENALATQYAELIKVQGRLTDEMLATMKKREADYSAERHRFVNTVLQALSWTGKIQSVNRRLDALQHPVAHEQDNGSPQSQRLTDPGEV